MKDQHTKIKGYRDLSQEEIDLMNEIKETAESVRVVMDKLKASSPFPDRWVGIAEDHLQQGFMAAVRSVAKPESY